MIKPDFVKWGETLEDIRQMASKTEHERSRERFQALYEIGRGQVSATEWAQVNNRQPRTVLGWVHTYNQQGAAAVCYQHTGGRRPSLGVNEQEKIVETMLTP